MEEDHNHDMKNSDDGEDEDDVELENIKEDNPVNKVSEDKKYDDSDLDEGSIDDREVFFLPCWTRKDDDEIATDDVDLRPDNAFGSGGQDKRGSPFWFVSLF